MLPSLLSSHAPTCDLASLTIRTHVCSIAYKRNSLKDALTLLSTIEEIFSRHREKIEAPESAVLKEEAECYYTHACISTETGDFHLSLVNFQKASEIVEKLCGMVHGASKAWLDDMRFATTGGTANSLNGLGRYEESEKAYEDALAICTDEFSIYQINYRRNQWAAGKLLDAEHGLREFLQRKADACGIDDTQDFL